MELDDLKNIWNQEADKISASQHADPAMLQEMLHYKSKDTISRLRANLLFEYYFTWATLAGCIIAFPIFRMPEIRIAIITLFVICLVFLFYYRVQIKLMKSIAPTGLNMSSELKLLMGKFNQYLRFYRVTYRILIPFSMLLGLNLGGQLTEKNNWETIISSPVALGLMLILMIGIAYALDRLILWYLFRLYGRHLEHLKHLLTELEE